MKLLTPLGGDVIHEKRLLPHELSESWTPPVGTNVCSIYKTYCAKSLGHHQQKDLTQATKACNGAIMSCNPQRNKK